MCSGAEGASALTTSQYAQLGATAAQGLSQVLYAEMQRTQAHADAATERDAAQQQAEQILRAAARRRAEARAATAASGAKLDQFARGVEEEILGAGEHDAAMAILSADRRARALRTQGKLYRAQSLNAFAGSMFEGAYKISGWRGTNGAPYSYNDDVRGERFSATGEAARSRR